MFSVASVGTVGAISIGVLSEYGVTVVLLITRCPRPDLTHQIAPTIIEIAANPPITPPTIPPIGADFGTGLGVPLEVEVLNTGVDLGVLGVTVGEALDTNIGVLVVEALDTNIDSEVVVVVRPNDRVGFKFVRLEIREASVENLRGIPAEKRAVHGSLRNLLGLVLLKPIALQL